MQIRGHNTLFNRDKVAIARNNQKPKKMNVDTQELAHLVGNKRYNKGISVTTELTHTLPIRSNTATTGITAGYVATTLIMTIQVELVYAPRLGIIIK